MFDFSEIVDVVGDVLEKYKNLPNIEVEGRLGIYDSENNLFDSNIGIEYYDCIKSLLDSCNKWESKDDINSLDIFHDKLRLTTNVSNAQQYCIEKKKLASFTFVNETGPLDFRLSISKEDPIRVEKFPTKNRTVMKQREKNRVQHKLKNYNYDITKISSKTGNTVEECFEYEVEFRESIENFKSKNIIYSIIHKLLDATYACDGFVKTCDNELPIDNLNIHMVKEFK